MITVRIRPVQTVEKEGKENRGIGSNSTRTSVDEKDSKETVTWADVTRGNSEKGRILAKILE